MKRNYGNDFAEYRKLTRIVEPGTCVCENGDETLSPTIKRMQKCSYIVSDTYGICIGERTKQSLPIAVAGRVLAKIKQEIPVEEQKNYIGNPVCSEENGMIGIMTDIEAKICPECIVGYIIAFPQDDYYSKAQIPIKNRIWIRVK